MSQGDGEHSFGHGSHCYWCGVDGDSPEIEKPCDERDNRKPSDEEMAAFDARRVRGETAAAVAEDYGMGMIEWDEMLARIAALAPVKES